MDVVFLVQIRQSKKCGSVRNDEIINSVNNDELTLGIWCGPLSQQHPLPLARHQSHLLIPSAKIINQEKKESRNDIQLPTNRIELPWPTYTEPRAKRRDLEPSPKRCSDKINMLKQGKNTQKKASHIVQPGLTYGSQHLER